VSSLPTTVAWNRLVAPASRSTRAGSMEIEISGGAALTVISASAVFPGSAWLDATTWNTPADEGAV
jgi:hypothetical protein